MTALVAAAAIAAGALAEQSFTDPAGDASGYPDILGVSVSNHPSGIVQFTITLGSPLGDPFIGIFLDADNRADTGSFGAERLLVAGPNRTPALYTWDGSTLYTSAISPPGLSVSGLTTNTVTIAFDRSAIGTPASFGFAVRVVTVSSSNVLENRDLAPDSGQYTYTVVIPRCANGKDDDGDGKADLLDPGCGGIDDDNEADDPVNVALGKQVVRPARPIAGKGVTVSMPATRHETGEPLPSAKVSCSARVGSGRRFAGKGTFAGGRAICTFQIPKTAKGKRVTGVVTVRYGTAFESAPIAFRMAG